MSNMEFSFRAECLLTLEHKKESNKSKHISTDINLYLSDGLNKDIYLDKEDLPTKEGSHVLTNVLTQGLIANIHYCHELGFRDSAEHLRFIISELERGFIQVTNVSISEF